MKKDRISDWRKPVRQTNEIGALGISHSRLMCVGFSTNFWTNLLHFRLAAIRGWPRMWLMLEDDTVPNRISLSKQWRSRDRSSSSETHVTWKHTKDIIHRPANYQLEQLEKIYHHPLRGSYQQTKENHLIFDGDLLPRENGNQGLASQNFEIFRRNLPDFAEEK